MKEYLFEMHAHSSEVSSCANEDSYSLLNLYTKLKYDGVVLTNHMNSHTFSAVGMEDEPWDKKAEYFLSGYKKLKDAAEGKLTVLLGMEICFYSCPNDYLVYGIDENFIKNNGDLMALTPRQFSNLARKNGLLFIQAHPFRRGMKIEEWKILDGYEVFNGNPRHYSSNEIAESWAKYHNKTIVTSGSDFHEIEDAGNGGIYFSEPVLTNGDLVRLLKSGAYRLKKTDFEHTRSE